MTSNIAGFNTYNFFHRPVKMADICDSSVKRSLDTRIHRCHCREQSCEYGVFEDDLFLDRLLSDHPGYMIGRETIFISRLPLWWGSCDQVESSPHGVLLTSSIFERDDDTSLDNDDRFTVGSEYDNGILLLNDDSSNCVGLDKSFSTCSTMSMGDSDSDFDSVVDASDRKDAYSIMTAETEPETMIKHSKPSPTQEAWQVRPQIIADTALSVPTFPLPPLTPCLYTDKQLKLFRPWLPQELEKAASK
ncbi:hypothetical protein MPSEU_000400500 [Mayamaea pseudoterrestris]|nr:hypothetical protein MPSEU_000400500 [Mayamaea pseudoterrestris]